MGSESDLWYKDAVIYQLHVKAFADGNDDGVGDFAGLMAKLPYIRSLGVTAIWLLPFYPSPLRDDGYDIADYKGVHPAYGTLRDVRAFVRAAHKHDLRVITELVINHTSDRHPWFQRARRAPPGSRDRKFYVWSDTPAAYAGTRIIFTDTETSNWAWDPVAGQYYWHRFFSHQPDLNFDHPPVFEAIVDVMRFWFALGIDGMRLDAVPYLCEREGTNNENLPETHAVLKRLRAIVDAEFPGRCFLAEANQWPEDVRAYFGDGDECHMAFHFPLMPRMFMSIAEEDRYPLYDIVRQTPPIPEGSQWAVFLRNHDELTLEMVTDRERAFMYSVYAPDERARLNVGIRRRLAPLMDNDRRKIELMTSLLFSMPGTPIVYYGDEIGMGDNIYLGDRDGVRTPMQWSGDRNGGFSRADTQRLYLPPVMDPVYGYPAVNVEAQERSPSSLVHWVRRLIGVRSAHRVFGRGTLTLLHPDNRHVAAYVREAEDERVLCVANLARTPQAVALDLARFAGLTPVEMIGWSAFPPIGGDRYVLTLPGHAFFWFVLTEPSAAPIAPAGAAPPLPEYVTLVLPRGRASLVVEPARSALERDVVPAVLTARELTPAGDVQLVDVIALGPGDEGPELALFGDDAGEAFVLPFELAYERAGDANAPFARAAFARARTGPREGLLFDAAIDEGLWNALLAGIRAGSTFAGTRGTLLCEAMWSLDALAPAESTGVRTPQAGDRRVSAVIDETVQLHLFARTAPGCHPAIELALRLHEAHFANTPPLLGTLRYRPAAGGDDIAVGLARRYVLSPGDAWTVLHTMLLRSLDRSRARPASDGEGVATADPTAVERIVGLAGTRLAEFHAALADPDDPAFAPETLPESDAAVTRSRMLTLAACAFAQLEGAAPADPATLRAVRERVDAIAADAPLAGTRIARGHGDFQLRRVLVTEGDVLIIDPGIGGVARRAAQRERKVSPLADVASMIRSLDEVTAAAAFDVASDPTEDPARFVPVIREAVRVTATTFARTYLARAAELGVFDGDRATARGLIEFYLARDLLDRIVAGVPERFARPRVPGEALTRIFQRTEVAL